MPLGNYLKLTPLVARGLLPRADTQVQSNTPWSFGAHWSQVLYAH
jgi:hypothetical protein